MKLAKNKKKKWALIIFVVLLYIALGGMAKGYIGHLIILTGIYMILTIGFSILFGQGGLISMAHGAFYGIGAYASSVLEVNFHVPVLVGLPLSFAFPCFIAYLMGRPLLRLRVLYLAIGTLAFGQICMVLFKEPAKYTGGYSGLSGIPPVSIGAFIVSDQTMERYYYLTYFLLALFLFLAINLVNGKIGRAIRALRDNETAAQAMGINPMEYHTYIFAFTSGFAGVAGWLYAHYAGHISPPLFTTHFSILIMLMLFIGGLRSLWGAGLGAIFLAFVPPYIGYFGEFEHIIYGVLIIVVLMYMPRGLFGIIQDAFRRTRFYLGRSTL